MIKINVKKTYCYICIVLILYNTASIYNLVWPKLDYPIDGFSCFFLAVSFVGIRKRDIINILKTTFFITCIMLLLSINGLNIITELIYIFAFSARLTSVLIFVMWCYRNHINVLNIFANTMVCCAVIFLLFYIFFDYGLLGEGKKILVERGRFDQVRTQFVMTSYYNIYYRWADDVRILGVRLMKTNGPFSEAGQYQIYLNFALIYFRLIDRENKNKIKIIILSMAVISTTSTMGIIIMLCVWAISKIKNDKKYLIMESFLVILAAAMADIILIEKFQVYGVYSRNLNLEWAIETWMNNFWLGIGYNNYSLSYYGLLNYFIHFGVLGICPVYLFVGSDLRGAFGGGLKIKLAAGIWWFGCMMNEPIGYTFFMCMIYGICLIKGGRNKNMKYGEIR